MRKKPSIKLENKQDISLLAVSGIANYQSFYESLIEKKISITKHLKYKDHHNYSKKDMEYIYQCANKLKCSGVVTTSKDYYKLKNLNKKNIKIYRLDIDFLPVKDDILISNELINKIKNKL